MASQGPLSPSVGADGGGGNNNTWSNPGNIVASDNSYASTGFGFQISDKVVQLLVAGAGSGNNNSAGADWPGSDAYASFGSSSDLWGLALTVAQVNAAGFGFQVQGQDSGHTSFSNFIQATGFGFTIPAGATINGVVVEIERNYGASFASVDHMRVTVFYTPAAALARRPFPGLPAAVLAM